MYKGKQTGHLWTDGTGLNGIYIEIDEYGVGVDFIRIVNGENDNILQPAAMRDVYDERQGNAVAGIVLTDYEGNPTNEVYKLRDFQMSGNLQQDNSYNMFGF